MKSRRLSDNVSHLGRHDLDGKALRKLATKARDVPSWQSIVGGT
jgi:hypothetical protein